MIIELQKNKNYNFLRALNLLANCQKRIDNNEVVRYKDITPILRLAEKCTKCEFDEIYAKAMRIAINQLHI